MSSAQPQSPGFALGNPAVDTDLQVIHNTFTPLSKDGQALPTDLAPKLLHRFASKEGYDVERGLVSTLRTLKQQQGSPDGRRFDKIVIGVVTNSDDRVPGILSSFGLNVSPMRYGTQIDDTAALSRTDYDIDFHCMSYDVGVEKPDKKIFDSAEHTLPQVLAAQTGKSLAETEADIETCFWAKVYVGDEYGKDGVGARDAGWEPVLLDTDGAFGDLLPKLPVTNDRKTRFFSFVGHDVAKVASIRELVKWLTSP